MVDGRDVVAALAVVEDADDGAMSTVDGANDAPFGAAVGPDIADFDQHQVPVHGRTDSWRRDKDVPGELGFQRLLERSGVGNDKAKAIAMHAELTDNHVLAAGRLGESVAVGLDRNELAAGYQALRDGRRVRDGHRRGGPTRGPVA